MAASLSQLLNWAREVSTEHLKTGADVREALVKVAHEQRLSQEEIKIITGHANKFLTVNMNQKVASKALPLGATVKMTSASDVIDDLRRKSLAADPAQATPPPALNPKQRLAQPAVGPDALPKPKPATEPTASDMFREPLLALNSTSVADLVEARGMAEQDLRDTRMKAASAHARHRELKAQLERGFDDAILRKTATVADLNVGLMALSSACDVLIKRAEEKRWPRGEATHGVEFNREHPLFKAALDLERVERDMSVYDAHTASLNDFVDVVNARVAHLMRMSRRTP